MSRRMQNPSLSGSVSVRAVAFEEQGIWVAQCVEHDIAAHADSLSKLRAALELAILRNVSCNAELGRVGLDGIPPAPARFRDLYDRDASQVITPVRRPRSRSTAGQVRVHDMRLVENRAA